MTIARTDLQLFSQLHRGQARIWRRRQLRLQRLVDDLPEGAEMPDALLTELQRIDTFLAKSSAAAIHVQEAEEEAQASLPVEQLEAQLAAELVAAAKKWTARQWRLVISQAPDEVLEARMS